jgi:hypothetical protein
VLISSLAAHLHLEESITCIVSGSIKTVLGKVDSDSRVAQTLQTFSSIRRNYPKSQVIYIESGLGPSTVAESQSFSKLQLATDITINLSEDEDINNVRNTFRFIRDARKHPAAEGAEKSALEALALSKGFSVLSISPLDAVVKLSGRYIFREIQSPFFTSPLRGGFTVLKPKTTYLRPKIEGFPKYVRSVAWASKGQSTYSLSEIFGRISREVVDRAQLSSFIDLEHGLYKEIGADCLYVNKLGIEGIVASSGQRIRL